MVASAMTTTSKTALVTGGSKGIGRAIALALLAEGLNVTITGRTAATLSETATELEREGDAAGRVLALECDVRDLEQQRAAVDKTVQTFGTLDLLVANAGIGLFQPVDKIAAEDWQAVLDTNLTGVFNSVSAAVDALKRSRGLIVTIGSLAGVNAFAGGAAYNASKFGVLGFSHAIMLDLRPHDVRVSTIMPGSVTSNFNDHEPSEKDAWKVRPEDIAATVVYLLHMPTRTLPSRIEVRPSKPPSR